MRLLLKTFPILCLGILFPTCSDSESNPALSGLYFHGGMDSVSIVNEAGTLTFDGWESLRNHELVRDFDINNSGTAEFAYQEIVPNPTDPNEKVLHAVVVDDDPTNSVTSRAQMSIRMEDGVDLDVYHTSVRMFIDEDVAELKQYPDKVSWFVVFETWNKRVPEWDGSSTGSARWNLNIHKDAGSKALYWLVEAETMQPAASEQVLFWSYTNKTAAVPIGKWFIMDVYLKRGEGTNGRFRIKITPDGESPITLFDVKNTTVYPGHPEIQLISWQAFKFYFSDKYLDYMRGLGKNPSCYYNDFKWYKN